MTLIATCHRKGDGFFALADTLISLSNPLEGDQNSLPLQFGMGNGFGTHGIRCASKAVLFDDYIVLWSGRVDSAQPIITKFKSLKRPSIGDFQRVIDENIDLCKDLRLIYGCNSGESIWWNDWGCKSKKGDGFEFVAGGSGDDDFLDGLPIQKQNFESSERKKPISVGDQILMQLGELIRTELTSITHKWNAFGGAYELFQPSINGGFERVNYAISECSNRLHVEQKWSEHMETSRLIQCVGKGDRSLFCVYLFSPEGNHKIANFDVRDITEIGAPTRVKITPDELKPDLSFSYVIGTQYLWSINPETHFMRFVYDVEKQTISVHINTDEIQTVVDTYYENGGGFILGSDGYDPWADEEV